MGNEASSLLDERVTVAAATSAAAAHEAPPPPAPRRPFHIPATNTLVLDNGLKATLVDFGFAPKVAVAISVRSGRLNDGHHTWISEMTGALLKEGTGWRTAGQIAETAALMGGQIAIRVEDDETLMSLDVLSEYGADAVELLAEILTQPKLSQRELSRIRQNYDRELNVRLTRPGVIANAAFLAALYPDHPYGRLFPTPGQLQAYTIEDVRQHYACNYGARRSHVYVVGRFDHVAVETAIHATLGGWREGPEPLNLPPSVKRSRSVGLIDRPGALQSTVYAGLRVIDPTRDDFTALTIADAMIGGGLISRVTMNLRETRGWAYCPGSELATKRHEAAWYQYADVTSTATGPALTEIFREIDTLRAHPPTLQELTAAKNYLNGVFGISASTRGGLVKQLAFVNLQNLPPDRLTTFVERLYAVTQQDITRVMQNCLDPAEMSVIVVGDLSAVRSQVMSVEHLSNARMNCPLQPWLDS